MLLGPVNSMGKIAGVSQFCEILEVLRCTDDKFCDLSGADALALQQAEDTSTASGSAESTVVVRDPSSLQELISALTAKIPPPNCCMGLEANQRGRDHRQRVHRPLHAHAPHVVLGTLAARQFAGPSNAVHTHPFCKG
jgi:hypothetical protein